MDLLLRGWAENKQYLKPPAFRINAKESLNVRLPSGKLTWQWKIPILNGKNIFKWWIFHCYVRLPECIYLSPLNFGPAVSLASSDVGRTSSLPIHSPQVVRNGDTFETYIPTSSFFGMSQYGIPSKMRLVTGNVGNRRTSNKVASNS